MNFAMGYNSIKNTEREENTRDSFALTSLIYQLTISDVKKSRYFSDYNTKESWCNGLGSVMVASRRSEDSNLNLHKYGCDYH